MSKIRTTLVTVAADFLEAVSSPVTVLRDCADGTRQPPYALFRVGGAENMFPGQAAVWEITLLCAVVHDADTATAEQAEAGAEEVFALLEDGEAFIAFASGRLLVSAFETVSTELTILDGHWQHIAGFRVICAPAD